MMARRVMGRGGLPSGLLIPTPAAPPSIGDALAGGYYTGAAWDTVTTATATIDIASVAATDILTIAIPEESTTSALYYPITQWPFYLGQSVRLAPINNTTQVFIEATVTGRTASGLSVRVDSKTGSTGSFADWVVAARWKAILAPKSGGESTGDLQYKTSNSSAPVECKTLTNGRAATAAMIAANVVAGSVIYSAADFVREINGAALAGYSDWEMPARDWLELIWRNLKPVTNNNYLASRPKANTYFLDANIDDILNEPRGLNRHSVPPGAGYTALDPAQTAAAAFQIGGAQAMAWETYFWSSSEYSGTRAWGQVYTTSLPGAQAHGLNKTNGHRVRAVRREIL